MYILEVVTVNTMLQKYPYNDIFLHVRIHIMNILCL